MSLNYAFGFSLILLLLVGLNLYFFYTLNNVREKNTPYTSLNVPKVKENIGPDLFKEIYEYLNLLPIQYKSRNEKFLPIQKNLIQKFNITQVTNNTDYVWKETENWEKNEIRFPHIFSIPGKILHAMRTTKIIKVDISPKGTQLKLLLKLKGKKKLFFKPKRYSLKKVINGDIYAGYDRHNSEVFAYYLAAVMNFKWIAPSVIRRLHVSNDVLPVATERLNETMVKKGTQLCIYGKCLYCKAYKAVCPDERGEIEGAAILLFENKLFTTKWSPWRRSYSHEIKMEWETDKHYCKKVLNLFPLNHILDLVDVSVFDFLIQNGDRHHYQVYNGNIMLFDNGKGLGNPTVDQLDILAPLYQCCMISYTTWRHLEMLSGGVLTETIKLLSSFQGEMLATEDHYRAVERRLLKIYATIQYCIEKHGSAKVFMIS